MNIRLYGIQTNFEWITISILIQSVIWRYNHKLEKKKKVVGNFVCLTYCRTYCPDKIVVDTLVWDFCWECMCHKMVPAEEDYNTQRIQNFLQKKQLITHKITPKRAWSSGDFKSLQKMRSNLETLSSIFHLERSYSPTSN